MVLVTAGMRLVVIAAPAQHTSIMVVLNAGIPCSKGDAHAAMNFLELTSPVPERALGEPFDTFDTPTRALLDAKEVLVLGQSQDEVIRDVLACKSQKGRKQVRLLSLG